MLTMARLSQKKKNNSIKILFWLLLVVGCRPQDMRSAEESGSEVKGYPFGKYLKGIYAESGLLEEVGTALHKNLVKSIQENRGLLARQVTPRQLLGAEVIKLLSENHFLLNREQLAKVLKLLTDPNAEKANACAGAPCARVFGFRSEDVETILDEILGRLVANPNTLDNLGIVKRNALLYGLSAKFKAPEIQRGFLNALDDDDQAYYQYFYHRDLQTVRSLTVDVIVMDVASKGGLGFGELSRLPNLKVLEIEGIWAQPEVLKKLLEEKSYVQQAKSVRLNIQDDATVMFNRHPDMILNLLKLHRLEHLTLNVASLDILREFKIKSIPENIRSVAFEVRGPKPKEGPNIEWSLAPFFEGSHDRRPEVRFVYDARLDQNRSKHHLTFEK
jgi:hypothetical protein